MSDRPANVLVVPTNRPDQMVDFARRWEGHGFDMLLIVYDGPEAPQTLLDLADDPKIAVTDWAGARGVSCPEVFSRGDSAVRGLGIYKAWQAGAKLICTLDDDCAPAQTGFGPGYLLGVHRRNLCGGVEQWVSTVPGLRVRGLPYHNQGMIDPAFSVGLWSGCPDVDAPVSLVRGHVPLPPAEVEKLGTRVMPSAQYFPFSGMNFAFTREMTPLVYFPPMGQGSLYRRFDDIWAGLVIQRICRQLNRAITVGGPVVVHGRLSNPFANLTAEAPGIAANEQVWPIIDAAPLGGHTPVECMFEMARHLMAYEGGDAELAAYVRRWGSYMQKWTHLFL